MKNKTSSTWLWLLAILIVGGIFRALFLTHIPNGLNRDEIGHGYDALCLLKTLRDQWGNFLPINFRAVDDWNPGVANYTTVLWVALLGPTDLAIRLTPFFYGMLTLLTTYFLARRIFDSRTSGLWAAFFVAIAPWHIHYSRFAVLNIMVPFFTTLGLALFLKGLEENKKWPWAAAAISFGLAFHTYIVAYIFTPLFLAGIVLFFHRDLWRRKKELLIPSILFLILIAPIVYDYLHGDILMRGRHVLFIQRHDLSVAEKIKMFWQNYSYFFSISYLFSKGHTVYGDWIGKHGALYWIDLPLVLLGIGAVLRERGKKRLFLLWWLLIYPLAPSLTQDHLNLEIRSSTALPIFQMLAAAGTAALFGWAWKAFSARPKWNLWLRRITVCLFCASLVACVHKFSRKYFFRFPIKYAEDSQYGMEQTCHYIRKVMDRYDRIVISGNLSDNARRRPNLFLAYYLPIAPAEYEKMPKALTNESVVVKFGKFQVNYKNRIQRPRPGERVLYVVKEDECRGAAVLKRIYYPDGKVVYKICEYQDQSMLAAVDL